MGSSEGGPASLPHLTSDLLINGPGGFRHAGLAFKRRLPLRLLNWELHSHACSKPAGVEVKGALAVSRDDRGESVIRAVSADPRLNPKPNLPCTRSF